MNAIVSPMKAASDFENALRKTFAQAMKDGVSPLLAIGIVEAVKTDILGNMRAQAAEMQRSQIVRSSILPTNGHS